MKTLFIYPGITGIGYNSFGYCRDSGNITGTAIPLGIGYLASALEQAGFEADVLDLRHCKGKQEAEEIISKSEADIVAISVQTPSFHHAVELAVISKKYNKTVVAGGIHATVLPEDFIKTGVFDHVIRGEGEFSLVELVQNLESGRPSPSIIQGIWVTEMDMFPMAKDFPVYREIYRSVHNVEFGRGCPAKCTYCVSGEEFLFGPGIKQRSLKSVFESLRYYNKYNFYNIAIEDVNATTDRKRFVKFCEMLAEFKPNVRLTISTRVDSFNQEIATALSLLNEAIVWFGFESMSSRLMKFLNKGVNIKKNYAAAEICHRHGIDIGANVLVGIPTETTGDIKKTYDFIKDISPSQLYYNVLSPFPGTKIAEYCKSKGVLADIESYERYDVGQVIQKGIIKSVDYDVVRAWMPKFYECVKGHSRALPLERGLVFERGCDFDKAFIEYGKALKSNEDPVRTLYHLGSLLKRTGKSDAALETFNKMNRFDGSANSQNLFYLAQRHFHRGELFYEKKEREMAKKDFQECLTLMPEHKKAREKLNALERK